MGISCFFCVVFLCEQLSQSSLKLLRDVILAHSHSDSHPFRVPGLFNVSMKDGQNSLIHEGVFTKKAH